MKNIEVYIENTQQTKAYPFGITLNEIVKELNLQSGFPVCGALVNNKVRELSFRVVKPKNIQFIDYSHPDGQLMYSRSLFFLMYAAVKDLFPDAKLKIDHAISRGFYCELEGLEVEFCDNCVNEIKYRMQDLVTENIPYERQEKRLDKVLETYAQNSLDDKVSLYADSGWLYVSICSMGQFSNYFHGHLLPATGYIKNFDLERFNGGMLLRLPSEQRFSRLRDFVQEDKLFGIFREHKEWAEILDVENIGKLNGFVKQGKAGEIIKISEALHEKKI
ncbi:MAG: nucleoside kinase, partial [Prolixibacteraceae bacterium]|nr:nucleoside kinase [Prolixibacteraceae bacterium]